MASPEDPKKPSKSRPAADWVAIILAAGISLSLLLMTAAALYAALSPEYGNQRLGENSTQVLTGWGGGMLGVLGAYVGYAFGVKSNNGFGIPPPKAEPKEMK